MGRNDAVRRDSGELEPASGRLRLLAAFAAIYLIWGSTYLAIRFAVETLPPFLMAGVRFVMAGLLMYGWARLRGARRPEPAFWVTAAVIGTLMFVFGVGGVSWAEQYMPSGAAALLVTVGPLWMVLVDWLYFGGEQPGLAIIVGLLLGFCGVAVLVGPEELAGSGRIDVLGAGVILFGTITWAFGSLHTRSARLPDSPVLAIGMEMLAGGVILLLVGSVAGEWGRVAASQISLRSLLSLAYLIAFGSIIALSAYLWLLKVVSPARVITHAYVNPVVAVLLGYALAAEPLNRRTLIATAVIVTAVLFILTRRVTRRPPVVGVEHG